MKSFVKLGSQLQGKLKEMGFLHQESWILGCYFWMFFYININTSYLFKRSSVDCYLRSRVREKKRGNRFSI